jgi:hypothetical protein
MKEVHTMYAKLTNDTRKAVYRRDGWQCAICGSTRFLQIHHYIHRGCGGSDDPMNLITLCSDCHAMAHGINLVGHPDLSQCLIEQEIVEYLADMYLEEWWPWRTLWGPGGR